MAEEDKSTLGWYKVPTWDGSPATWRSFQREMQWWLCSLDVESTKKFNLAARWLLRQSGVVRQRGEEFSPKELEYTREVRAKDPDGVEIVVTPEDPFSGINKLLAALEEINGKTALDKKGELRRQFYTELSRRPGERPADFLSRFRFLVAELKSEGIDLPSSELGWFVREKLPFAGSSQRQRFRQGWAGTFSRSWGKAQPRVQETRCVPRLRASRTLGRRCGLQSPRGWPREAEGRRPWRGITCVFGALWLTPSARSACGDLCG